MKALRDLNIFILERSLGLDRIENDIPPIQNPLILILMTY